MTTRALSRLLPIALCALLALPAAAGAASGETTLQLGGAGLSSLKRQKVKVSALAPAKLTRNTLTLPVASGLVGDSATLVQGGSIRFKKGRRKLSATSLRLVLGGSQSGLAGRFGGKQMTVFTIRAQADATTVNKLVGAARLSKGSITLSRAAAKLIKKKLRLRRAPKRGFGSVAASALVGGEAAVVPDTRPGCSLPEQAPSGAVAVSGVTVDWHVRESWVSYLRAFGGDAFPIAPATRPGPTIYDFALGAPLSGWYDPTNQVARLTGSGGVWFSQPAHGIDIRTTDPIIEINGASCSRATFAYGDGQRRGVVDLTAGSPTVAGKALTYALPATMSGEATPYFAYPAGSEWGSMTVSFTTP